MAISSLGVGSGLDLSSLVSSLMEVERLPLQALEKRETAVQARISSLATLNSSLDALRTAAEGLFSATGETATEKFSTLKTVFGDKNLLTATASTDAIPATYNLSNIVLARPEQIRKSAAAIQIPSATDGSGNGTLTISVGGSNVDIAAEGGWSLEQVVSAINDSGAGVTASIINDGTTDHLIITADDTGDNNQITITASGNGDWSDFEYAPSGGSEAPYSNNDWTEQQRARSASLTINGLPVTSESNTLPSNVISGLSLTLTAESVTGTTLTVSKDTSTSLTSAVTGFITAYNSAVTSMKNLGYYDADKKTAGALQGDSTLRGAQNQLRNLLLTQSGGTSVYKTLSSIGIEIQKDGTLKLGESGGTTKLSTAIAADFSGVANLVATVGAAFQDGINNLIGTGGSVTVATESSKSLIKDIDKRQAALEARLALVEARYTRQFSALDTLIANMNQTSTYLTQQLASLPKINSSNN